MVDTTEPARAHATTNEADSSLTNGAKAIPHNASKVKNETHAKAAEAMAANANLTTFAGTCVEVERATAMPFRLPASLPPGQALSRKNPPRRAGCRRRQSTNQRR
jgi:hypothetical protein